MKVPLVQNCCFCINLRTGALVLGWLGTIGCSILVATSIVGLIFFNATEQMDHDLLARLEKDQQQGNDVHAQIEAVKMMIDMLPILYISLWIELVLCCFGLLSSVLLLIGVYKHRLSFIKQWPIISVFLLVIGIVYQVVVVFMSPESIRETLISSYLITDIFGIGK